MGIKRQSGFALAIALSLMAFVLLLILSLSSFVVVEQHSAKIAKQQLSARQNALAGLQIAMGELQMRLGPDQRATASADILKVENNPYTLVWHSDATKTWDSTALDWIDNGDSPDFALPLVSVDPAKLGSLISNIGEFDDTQLDNPDSPAIDLMAVTNPSDGTLTSLKGERRPLIDPNGAVTGNYAWVAQDESLKANLKTEHGGTVTKDANGNVVDSGHKLALVETSRRLSVFPYANAAGVEMPDGSTPFSSIDPVAADGSLNTTYFDKIEKASTLIDLITSEILQPANTTGTTAEKLAPYQNHFTLYSKGVLADSKNGGLRRDLSRGLDDQYFEKLHGVPVFGVDRDDKVIADGINDPVGDQWKFFRDFYNFYRPVDDGLVDDLGDENIQYGLNDSTSVATSTRMRAGEEYVNSEINYMFSRSHGGGDNPSYSTAITPTVLNQQPSGVNEDSWYLFTPHVRPVVLRKEIRLGLSSKIYTNPKDPSDPNNGKYILQFKIYPAMVLWNPFNVTIDMAPSSSTNPLANTTALKFHVGGSIDIPIKVNGGDVYEVSVGSLAPYLVTYSEENFGSRPREMRPGEVVALGLGDTYTSYLEPWYNGKDFDAAGNLIANHLNKGDITSVSTGQKLNPKIAPLYPASNSYNVKGENCISFDNIHYRLEGQEQPVYDSNGDLVSYKNPVWEELYFNADDSIEILPTKNSTYWWQGFVVDRVSDHRPTFHLTENSELTEMDGVTKYSNITGLNDVTPFMIMHFSGRTLGKQSGYFANDSNDSTVTSYGNPAFPSFATVNFLGTSTLCVTRQNNRADFRALYIGERLTTDEPLDYFLSRDPDTGLSFFGESFDSSSGASRITLYDIPRHPIVSLGDFKNLSFTWYEDAPARPIGASWPIATLSDLSTTYIRSNNTSGSYDLGAGCDTSYYYNDALFDSYFFSGIPSKERDDDNSLREQTYPYDQAFTQDYIDAQKPLGNTRISYYQAPALNSLRDPTDIVSDTASHGFEKAAAHLMIDAPFNINSTSPEAWQAILSGFRAQSITGANETHDSKESYGGTGSPFVDNFIPSGGDDKLYSGYRRIDDSQIATLSRELTNEIRNRGIAKSLGSFLNRTPESDIDEAKRMSRIDRAIQLAGLNQNQKIATSTTDEKKVHPRPELIVQGVDAAHVFAKNLTTETGAGLPGYLKQQDILRPLAPIMTTRGDTFTVRTYGESVDPITGEVNGRAWCEAVLQRVPDYVDDLTDAWEVPANGTINKKFGRRLKVIQFRWLNEEEA